jgi:hypothetical protein
VRMIVQLTGQDVSQSTSDRWSLMLPNPSGGPATSTRDVLGHLAATLRDNNRAVPSITVVAWGTALTNQHQANMQAGIHLMQAMGSRWESDCLQFKTRSGAPCYWIQGFPVGESVVERQRNQDSFGVSPTPKRQQFVTVATAWCRYLLDESAGADKLGIAVVGFGDSDSRISEVFEGMGPVFAWLHL